MIKFFFGSDSDWPQTPVPNSYWVEPGWLLAGEYPGASRPDAASRLQALLQAGITSFIDLTAEGELPPYHSELGQFGAFDVVHRRFPIVDHGVPDSPATMMDIVETIAGDLDAGRRVYVHCRAGIGRTGMAVACYLIHRGLDAPAALERLQTLWRRCSRARSWPSVPETEEQVEFVHNWAAASISGSAAVQRAEGALIGLAIGEGAVIATTEHGLSEAAWLTDSKRLETWPTGADTAMTIAVAESLLAHGRHEPNDELRRYLAWTQQPGVQSRVPAELKRVLAVWQWSRKPNAGSHDPNNLDPHSLARSLAPALFARGDARAAAELAVEVSRTTQQSPIVLDACRILATTLSAALQGAPKMDLIGLRAVREALAGRALKPPLAQFLKGDWRPVEPRDSAPGLLVSAFDIFRFTNSFEAAVREAARTHSTCGAIVGALAGAFYGSRAVPIEWRRALAERETLCNLAARFAR
ncbi:MAG TPA: ADP-ribosylglycohydrolase family protein [Steroidobacteraceae bacterium]